MLREGERASSLMDPRCAHTNTHMCTLSNHAHTRTVVPPSHTYVLAPAHSHTHTHSTLHASPLLVGNCRAASALSLTLSIYRRLRLLSYAHTLWHSIHSLTLFLGDGTQCRSDNCNFRCRRTVHCRPSRVCARSLNASSHTRLSRIYLLSHVRVCFPVWLCVCVCVCVCVCARFLVCEGTVCVLCCVCCVLSCVAVIVLLCERCVQWVYVHSC